MNFLYVGVDIGKRHHHIAGINHDGTLFVSQRVQNDQADLQGRTGT